MNARRINAAAGVVLAAQKQRNTATGIAAALEAAGLLQSPESAAERAQLQDDITGACLARYEEEQENLRLRARVAELEAQAAELKADRADRQDDLAGALGHSKGTEWPDLISVAAAATASEARPVEDPHDSPLHHTYALGRDLPEVTPAAERLLSGDELKRALRGHLFGGGAS
ncbi:hypothetical protein JI76_28680 [Streptomyces anulatus]|uniref:hypothetical protein n=1 Tax=Streptomyces anulatus TaxID=1892 RepID=UPI0006D95550|nr:hypothetical protein [Streptomyces anulatus]KPL29095.1 hypothetical protein JI76_28680 [Streptomyces anulatus]